MCDSMDGRVLDPTSPVSGRLDMPNLRKLAAEGVNFVKTYAASPQCVPSRTTMLTGRRTDVIEAWSNSQALAAGINGTLDPACVAAYSADQCRAWSLQQSVRQTFVDAMEEAGCEMCMYGKVDIGADLIERPDQQQWSPTVPGYHGGPITAITGRSADIRKPTKPSPVSITSDDDNNVHPEDWKMVDQCIDWLTNHPPDIPVEKGMPSWMLYCSLNIPHPAFQTNATWLAYVNDAKVDVPTWLPQTAFHPADAYMSISKNVWQTNYTDADILKVRKTYYAMCAETDYLLGRVYSAAESSGHLANTYVVFVSDHGEMNMEHRQVWKNSMYEASARVPLIISGPGVRRGVVVSDTLVSLLDVFPTLVDMVGGVKPPYLNGASLMPLLNPSHPRSSNESVRQSVATSGIATPNASRFITAQYHSNMGNTGSFMVRHGPWKLVLFGTNGKAFASGYTPQLFNVDQDPEELHDMAISQPDVVATLKAMLATEYDYQAVDLRVKRNDRAIYQKFFVDPANGSAAKLRAKWEKSYRGFDDADWAKVQAWWAEELPPLPGRPIS